MQRVLTCDGRQWTPSKEDPVTLAGPRWVDIQAATEEEFRGLEQGFRFHPLAVEDCRHLDQRSKVEDYGDHVFIVLHSYSAPEGPASSPEALVLHELHIFLRPDLVVTVHARPLPALERVWARAVRGEKSICRGSGSIVHAVADEMVDQMYPVMDTLESDLEDLHARLLSPKPDEAIMRRILDIKQCVREMRRLTGPMREVLISLTKAPLPGLSEADLPYFRNVLDHLHEMQAHVELGREHVADVRDLYLTAQAARTNEIVKRLTVVATLGLPITAGTGFFGMNFESLPFNDDRVLYAAVVTMVVMPISMVAFLRWRRWV